MDFEPISAHRSRLGEGPVWTADPSGGEGALLYVDVHSGCICRWRAGAEPEVRRIADRVTFVLETDDGGLAVGLRHGIGRLPAFDAPLQGDLQPALLVEADRPTTSVNDARCDPAGRLWFGTLEREQRAPVCGLYRWTPGEGLTRAVEGVRLSNGLQFSPAGDRLYYVDSALQRLDVFDYDLATGTLGPRRTLAEIPAEAGMPDGITVDAEGFIYVALYGGGRLHRYAPSGRLEQIIGMPVKFPSSLTFGGEGLRTMFVTTSATGFHGSGGAHGDGPENNPLAGAVLAAALDTPGLPAVPLALGGTDLSP